MTSATPANPFSALVEDIGSYTADPLGFSKFAYGWSEGELASSDGPREWQAQILNDIGEHLQNEETRCKPLRIAVASGHGIGKSALVGMIIAWGMSTCEDCRITVTAGTGTQLATKTVPEVGKWFRYAINRNWWEVQATSVRSKAKRHDQSWRADYITWNAKNTEPFAGLHNKGKRLILIFDEASAIDDTVWDVANGALTDEDTEIIWIAFGNPTRNTGRFRECFGRLAHRWKTRQIDSRTVEGTNKAEIAEWVQDYGEDSDYVRVRVKGEFPRAGSNQFIASDVVAAARKYVATGFESLPKILSVDVARFGDDQTVIGTRQGRKAVVLGKYRGKDTVWTAEQTIRFMESERPDAVVIDGDGLGAGVVDQINHRGFGRRMFEFHGGASADDSSAYFNKRAEVWGAMRDWLNNAQIPDDPELDTDLTGVEYGFSSKQQIQLERKEDMKKRGMASPDCGDMLAMTFAVKVLAKPKEDPAPFSGSLNEITTAWMSGFIPFVSIPMTPNTKPNHIEPKVVIIALVVMGLYFAVNSALQAGRSSNKLPALNGSLHALLGSAFSAIRRVMKFLIFRPLSAIFRIRTAVLLASSLDILMIPFLDVFRMRRTTRLVIGSPRWGLVPFAHVSSGFSSFLFNSHASNLSSDDVNIKD